MFQKKKLIADSLFYTQIVCAAVFCGAYIVRSTHDITGSSAAQIGLVAVFLLFNLALGIGAFRALPSRVAKQAIATYIIWLVMVVVLIVVIALNQAYRWNAKDTTTVVAAVLVALAGVVLSRLKKLPLTDPAVRGLFAVACKAIPQFILAWKFFAEGASGTPALSIWLGHITIYIRLGQIYFMVKEAGWDRNRIWLAISEVANELSWLAATTVWLMV